MPPRKPCCYISRRLPAVLVALARCTFCCSSSSGPALQVSGTRRLQQAQQCGRKGRSTRGHVAGSCHARLCRLARALGVAAAAAGAAAGGCAVAALQWASPEPRGEREVAGSQQGWQTSVPARILHPRQQSAQSHALCRTHRRAARPSPSLSLSSAAAPSPSAEKGASERVNGQRWLGAAATTRVGGSCSTHYRHMRRAAERCWVWLGWHPPREGDVSYRPANRELGRVGRCEGEASGGVRG